MLCRHELHELDTLVTSALKRHVVEPVGASQLSWTCLSSLPLETLISSRIAHLIGLRES